MLFSRFISPLIEKESFLKPRSVIWELIPFVAVEPVKVYIASSYTDKLLINQVGWLVH